MRHPEVYAQIKPLPPACQPAWVVREDGATLVTVNPGTTFAQIIAWVVDHLTVDELNAYRAAYGEPPVGQHLSDFWLSDQPMSDWLPDSLSLGKSWLQDTA